jgi:hypothetical protein
MAVDKDSFTDQQWTFLTETLGLDEKTISNFNNVTLFSAYAKGKLTDEQVDFIWNKVSEGRRNGITNGLKNNFTEDQIKLMLSDKYSDDIASTLFNIFKNNPSLDVKVAEEVLDSIVKDGKDFSSNSNVLGIVIKMFESKKIGSPYIHDAIYFCKDENAIYALFNALLNGKIDNDDFSNIYYFEPDETMVNTLINAKEAFSGAGRNDIFKGIVKHDELKVNQINELINAIDNPEEENALIEKYKVLSRRSLKMKRLGGMKKF